jgi:hypothetical protein
MVLNAAKGREGRESLMGNLVVAVGIPIVVTTA